MKGWLLDTNVLSELRRPKPDARVVAFVSGQPLAIAGRKCQNLPIIQPGETSRCGSPEVDLMVTPNDRIDDDLVEVGICLKSDRHHRARGVCFFASASF